MNIVCSLARAITFVTALYSVTQPTEATAASIKPVLYESFSPKAAPDGFSWKVVNNFRIIAGQSEQDRYFNDLRKYYPRSAERRCWGSDFLSHGRCFIKALANGGLAGPTKTNYSTRWVSKDAQYESEWAINPARTILLQFRSVGPAPKECKWTFDDRAIASSRCSEVEVGTTLGPHKVKLELVDSANQSHASTHNFELKDILVLAIGDSYGAGEGAATVLKTGDAPAQWMDKRCHNSLYAGFALAAARLAIENPKHSVTFLTYACSGSEIDGPTEQFHGGLLSPFWGRETAFQVKKDYSHYRIAMPESQIPYEGNLPAQIDRARQALCPAQYFDAATWRCSNKLAQPDFVLISTGGNEVSFGPIIGDLATTLGGCDSRCRENVKAKFIAEVNALPGRYDALGRALLEFAPKAVLLAEYPNPIRDEKGRFCSDSFFAFRPIFLPRAIQGVPVLDLGLNGNTTEFAYGLFFSHLPTVMKSSADRNGWQFVNGIHDASKLKGYCSRRRWYNDYDTSASGQGTIPTQRKGQGGAASDVLKMGVSTGAMHPNMFGYAMMGDAIYQGMTQSTELK